jgi:uncharacterized membrane protein YqaE (UPF0057 family)
MKTSIKAIKALAAGVAASIIITSCSVEKRHYTSGYSIQWNSKKGNISATEASYVAKQTPKAESKKVVGNKVAVEAPVEQAAITSNTTTKTLVASANKTVYAPVAKTKNNSFENTVTNNNAKIVEKVAAANTAKAPVKGEGADIPVWGYILLAIFLPWLAVGFATNWDVLKTVIGVILWLLFWIPGIIYAFIILAMEGII